MSGGNRHHDIEEAREMNISQRRLTLAELSEPEECPEYYNGLFMVSYWIVLYVTSILALYGMYRLFCWVHSLVF